MLKIDESTLTSQGQISVPKRVRDRMGLKKGAKILFYEDDEGNILIREAELPEDLSRQDWDRFMNFTEKESSKRVNSKAAALKHLDSLARRK